MLENERRRDISHNFAKHASLEVENKGDKEKGLKRFTEFSTMG